MTDYINFENTVIDNEKAALVYFVTNHDDDARITALFESIYPEI